MSTSDRIEFKCSCCAGGDCTQAGSYALPPERDPDGGLVRVSYPLVCCSACGHVMAFPSPSEVDIANYYKSQAFWKSHGVDTSEVRNDWKEKLTGKSGLWERFERARRQFEFVSRGRTLNRETKIIDLGAGYSPFLFHCRRAGYVSLFALEPSESLCEYLSAEGVTTYAELLEEFVERDDLPLFDVMVISHTMEHLLDPARILKGLRRHLAPNGVIYVDVPFEDYLKPYHQGLHLQFFSVASMKELAHRTGYEVAALETDAHGWMERMVLAVLYQVYGAFFGGKGGVSNSGKINFLHRYVWRPVRHLLALRINIFISSQDLRALLVRTG